MRQALKNTGFFLVATILASHCHKSDDDSDSGNGNPKGFVNTADEATLKAQSEKFQGLLGHASSRAGVTSSAPKKSTNVMAVVEHFAGVSNDVESDDCSSIIAETGGPSELNLGSSAPKLTAGASCGDALADLKANYNALLKTVSGQVAALQNFDPAKTAICNMKAEKLPANSQTEAVAYRFTPTDAPENTHVALTLRAGANGSKVAYFSGVDIATSGNSMGLRVNGATTTGDDEKQNITLNANGSTAAFGDLDAQTIELDSAFAIAFNMAKNSMKMKLESNSQIAGLKDDEKIKITENTTTAFDLADENGKTNHVALTLNLTAQQIDDNTLHFTGKITNAADTTQSQSFDWTFVRSEAGMCTVSVPGSESANQNAKPQPPVSKKPLAAAQLQGTWTGDCTNARVGSEYVYRQESITFSGASVTRTLSTYSDGACSLPTMTTTQVGSFAIAGVNESSSRDDSNIDFKWASVSVTANTSDFVATLNKDKVCGATDWAAGKTITSATGACVLTSTYTMLNQYSLARSSEYNIVSITDDAVMSFGSVDFTTGVSQSKRPYDADISFVKR